MHRRGFSLIDQKLLKLRGSNRTQEFCPDFLFKLFFRDISYHRPKRKFPATLFDLGSKSGHKGVIFLYILEVRYIFYLCTKFEKEERTNKGNIIDLVTVVSVSKTAKYIFCIELLEVYT